MKRELKTFVVALWIAINCMISTSPSWAILFIGIANRASENQQAALVVVSTVVSTMLLYLMHDAIIRPNINRWVTWIKNKKHD